MTIITSKAVIRELLPGLLAQYTGNGPEALAAAIHSDLLQRKIRFPLLEYAAREIAAALPEQEHIPLTDALMELDEIGGNTLVGMILQLRLGAHHEASLEKAAMHIIRGNQWYVCDIIGERVMGHALLTAAEKTIPVLQRFALHPDKWIVRSVGVATHYAVKKGLQKAHAATMFTLLLSLSGATEFHTKKGIGWAAKTIAKFHPDIIAAEADRITADASVRPWFKTKIKIGLSRSFKYAAKYPG